MRNKATQLGIRWRMQPRSLLAGLAAAAALTMGFATPAGAQPATCAGLPATIVAASPGRIDGTAGSDVIVGSGGDDEIVGAGGNDTICAGAGNDTLVWNPGDGSDTIEGQDGTDLLLFNGSNANEAIDLSANGARLRFFRDVASITMDTDDVERATFNALGGADTIIVNSLAGTDVSEVNLSLTGALSGTTGDAQADSVTVNATSAADSIEIFGKDNSLSVTGLSANINLSAIDPALDSLRVNALEGDDTIDASALRGSDFKLFLSLIVVPNAAVSSAVVEPPAASEGATTDVAGAPPASAIQLTLNGGLGADTLIGSPGSDLVNGGDGDDIAIMGPGDDTFAWNPGDDNDTIEGQAGSDQLLFNGANVAENISISANGGRVIFFRDVANVTMDLDDTEQITFNALGGADTITVNSLAGTDMTQVGLNLAGTLGGSTGDGLVDTVIVNGTAAADAIAVAGSMGQVAATGLQAAVSVTTLEAATDRLTINGLAGDDTVSAATLPAGVVALAIDGGADNDTLTGSGENDSIVGGLGSDTLLGQGGSDLLFGGDGDDMLTGGDADDQAFGEGGNDRMIWNPGDDTDLNEGGDGTDTVEINGGNGAEVFTTTANGTRVRFDRLDPAPFAIDIGTSERLTLNTNGGDDSSSATGNLAALIQISVDGGVGNDTLLGSNGLDTLTGGDGNDFIDGQQGNDTAFLGAGDDIFQWDPGDGSDTVEGQADADTLLFNGSAGAEIFATSANGGRVLFTRNLGNIVMDLDDIEALDLNALGGTDTFTVNDLSGTDLVDISADLAGVIGGASGDAAADIVTINGTAAADVVDITGAGTAFSVAGLSADVSVTNSEGANDSLVVNGLGGNDSVTATTLPAGVVRITADGGAADDTLRGSQGVDVFLGGNGADFIFGDNGNDTAFLGADGDTFQWDPGDGNDVVEGQDGSDLLLFNGSNASENINISPNGGRVIFFRDVANVTMDLDDVEQITFNALGGADSIVANDLTGTDVTQLNFNLAASGGTGDGQADSVIVNGTAGADSVAVSGSAGSYIVDRLSADVSVTNSEGANDRLTVNGLAGTDSLSAAGLAAGTAILTFDGGDNDDNITGSPGNDTLIGGAGTDTILGGGGTDTIIP